MRFLAIGLRYLIAGVGGLALLVTLVSVVPATVWWVQVLGFARLQLLGVLALALVGLLALGWPAHPRARRALLAGWGVGLLIQAWFLWPYTPLAAKAVPDASPAQAHDSTGRVRVLVVNVLIKNRQDARLRQMVEAARPDVLLAMETNAWWVRALQPLRPRYPYRVELPREDSYGMVLYSRFPLASTQVQDLRQHRVPSISTTLRLPDGRSVTFFAVHPTPPIPDTYPDGVGERSIALGKVATFVRQHPEPAIVAGDFNDVPWSGTTHQLSRGSTLADARRGRGFYATFDADSHLMRWPLDQFFVTPQFRLVSLQRLADVGSDHFPIMAEFVLDPNSAGGR